jgi:hypothetical protein
MWAMPPMNIRTHNHSIQRMRASRLCQFQCGRHRRLARTADAGRWVPPDAMRTSLVVALLAGLLVGCSRAPSNVEVFTKTTELIDQYLHTNAVGAEAAMLQLERHMKAWEKAGYRGREDGSIPLDQAYASLCSRLHLVEKALGKQQAADQYYAAADEHWRKANAADPHPRKAGETIRDQIEGVDRYLGAPEWETQK